MTRLALLRHGHTAWNREHRIQGRTNIPLDDEARAQLSALNLPADWRGAQLVASPLARAQETGALIAGRSPNTSQALMEMDWGDWEGQHGATLRADVTSGFRDIENWGWNYRPPQGESPSDLRARMQPWLDSLTEDTVAICHIGTMRVVLALAWGWDFSGPCPFSIKRNRLYTLTKTAKGWRPDPEPTRLIKDT